MIVHICNNKNKWGKGFILPLSKLWPITKLKYHNMKMNLGNVEIIKVHDRTYVANMISQDGINYRNTKKIDRVDYQALYKCLEEVFLFAKDHQLEVHMPKIGSGLAGGDWEKIEDIINSLQEDVRTVVYII
jgi:O-acetyl-ADP-ribose deacetylase (regulator of RNase III)